MFQGVEMEIEGEEASRLKTVKRPTIRIGNELYPWMLEHMNRVRRFIAQHRGRYLTSLYEPTTSRGKVEKPAVAGRSVLLDAGWEDAAIDLVADYVNMTCRVAIRSWIPGHSRVYRMSERLDRRDRNAEIFPQ